MTHPYVHGPWARAARRRGEHFLGCTHCGQRRHPKQQAGPIEAEPQMPTVRLVNYFLAALGAWLCIIAWGLSAAHEAGIV